MMAIEHVIYVVILGCVFHSCTAEQTEKGKYLMDVMVNKGYKVADKYVSYDLCRKRLCFAKRYITQLQKNVTALQSTPPTFAACKKLCQETYGSYASNLFSIRQVAYYVSRDKKTWADAKAWCESSNMTIASLESSDLEPATLADLLYGTANTDEDFYIGLTDIATEGTFVWDSNGTPINDATFVTSTNTDALDCVTMTASIGYAYNINACSSVFRFVCKLNPVCNSVVDSTILPINF